MALIDQGTGKIEHVYCELLEEGVLTHWPSICTLLPVFGAAWLQMCVNMPVMQERRGRSGD